MFKTLKKAIRTIVDWYRLERRRLQIKDDRLVNR